MGSIDRNFKAEHQRLSVVKQMIGFKQPEENKALVTQPSRINCRWTQESWNELKNA